MPIPLMAQAAPHAVLVLEATTPNTSYFIGVNRAFNSAIATESLGQIYVYVETLAVRDFEEVEYPALLREFFREKYRGKNIGAIVAYNTLALLYAIRLRDEVWPGLPVIFTGVSDRHLRNMKVASNVTGITVRNRLQSAVDVARAMLPETKRIVLVGDKLGTEGFWQHFKEEVPLVEQSIAVTDLTGLPLTDVRTQIARLPQDAVILYLGLFRDGAGLSFVPSEALQLIAEVANRPIIVDTESFVGAGGTGGLVINFQDIGAAAARLVRRVLDGERAADIPIRDGDVIKPMFDWRQLQRWGIAENGLPPASEIRFRSPTAWEQYRWQIVLIAIALIGQSLLIAGLIHQRHHRRLAEVESHQRSAELARMNRRAIAGEMSASITHEVNQPLTAILSNAEAALDLLGRKDVDLDKVREIVTDIIDEDTRASEVVDRIRKFLGKGETRYQAVDLNQLVNSTLHLLHGEIVRRKTEIAAALDAALPQVSGDPVQLQQVLINLFINAMDAVDSKPPSQRMIRVSTRIDGKHAEVEIVDSGHGIAAGDERRLLEPFFTTKDNGLGLGLSICSTIVRAHRGTLTIENNKHGGATAVLSLATESDGLVPAS